MFTNARLSHWVVPTTCGNTRSSFRGGGRVREQLRRGALQIGEPVLVPRVFSSQDREEPVLYELGDLARLAGADRTAVELTDRRDLRRGAGEKRLFGDVDLVARESVFDHR